MDQQLSEFESHDLTDSEQAFSYSPRIHHVFTTYSPRIHHVFTKKTHKNNVFVACCQLLYSLPSGKLTKLWNMDR